MSPSLKSFEYEIVVKSEHLDDSDHVNNVVYVQFMQEIANKHWSSVTDNELADNVIWVVRRHEIDYFAEAFLYDRLLLKTWTGENTAATWIRYCEIIRIADQKKIITSKSVWVMLDRQTGKPKRIDDKLLKRFG